MKTEDEKLFKALCASTVPTVYLYYIVVELSLYVHTGKAPDMNNYQFAATSIWFAICCALTVFGVRKHKTGLASTLIGSILAFYMIPQAVATGTQIGGGSGMWFVVGALFFVISMTGIKRYVFLLADMILVIIFYWSGYYKEEAIEVSRSVSYIYSLLTVILVSLIVAIMASYEIRIQKRAYQRIEAQAKEIEQLNNSQNKFFSSMSHEIRTPINAILGLNEITLRENVSDEILENAVNIQYAGKMLLQLINDILDMSKFESGQMSLTPVEYDTGDMLSEIVGMLWLKAKDKGLDFQISVAEDLPSRLVGDDVRIRQILINVINNAIKYTSSGSVTLSIQCGERTDDKLNVIYSIADTGSGIKKEDIPYLFTAFKRMDDKENRHIEGTGLGLAIVKQFLDLMGGKITVNSVYTKGSTFVIEIPQKISDATKIGEFDMEKRHSLNNKVTYKKHFEAPEGKVLVVDDNKSNILVAAKLLKDTKMHIDTAESGEEALELTLDNEYDIILMDHLMPGMDGVECHKRITTQAGGASRKAKFIALTANSGSDMQALYAKEGFDGYLLKPMTGEELEREVLRLLPSDMVITTGESEDIAENSMSWMKSHERKKPVIISTDSVADLPKELIDRYDIAVIPHIIQTDEGRFRDGIEIEQSGLLTYMEDKKREVATIPPDVQTFEEFYAGLLEKANNVIHISISGKLANSGYGNASEAAEAFDNVSVFDSGQLSSGQGLLTICACELVEKGMHPDEIMKELPSIRDKVRTGFIVDNLDFLARGGQVSERVASVTRALMARPKLVLRKGKMTVGGIYFGSIERTWKKYINRCLVESHLIDKKMLFVTYVGLSKTETDWIRAYIEKVSDFENIYFKKASPAIAVNCGAGTFGLLYRLKD